MKQLIGLPSLLVVCLVLLFRPAAARAPPQELVQCINEGALDQFTTYKDFAYKNPVRLKLHNGWWASKEAAAQITVVTGLNPSRIKQLESQCRSWHGPISASVYVVMHNPKKGDPVPPEEWRKLEEAAEQLEEFHARMEALESGCQLDILLLYEIVLDEVMQVMLPINTLRNFALLQSRTELVSMVDVDLLVSNSLFEWVQDKNNYKLLRDGTLNKKVFVLPAFETAHQANETKAHELADAASAMSKAELSDLVKKRLVYQFAVFLFWQGHNSTDYKKWFSTNQPYPIEWHDGYEPWFVIDRAANPFYDSAFRGYGWNKVTHVANILHQKYTFLAHPAGFLVHRQHGRSPADKMYQAQKKRYEADLKANKITKDRPNNNLAGLTHRFRDQVYEAIDNGNYEPLLDEGVRHCYKALSWWRGSGGAGRRAEEPQEAAPQDAPSQEQAPKLGGMQAEVEEEEQPRRRSDEEAGTGEQKQEQEQQEQGVTEQKQQDGDQEGPDQKQQQADQEQEQKHDKGQVQEPKGQEQGQKDDMDVEQVQKDDEQEPKDVKDQEQDQDQEAKKERDQEPAEQTAGEDSEQKQDQQEAQPDEAQESKPSTAGGDASGGGEEAGGNDETPASGDDGDVKAAGDDNGKPNPTGMGGEGEGGGPAGGDADGDGLQAGNEEKGEGGGDSAGSDGAAAGGDSNSNGADSEDNPSTGSDKRRAEGEDGPTPSSDRRRRSLSVARALRSTVEHLFLKAWERW